MTTVTDSSMFEAAVSKFVKAVGSESLVPVPNLDEANRCRPLQVVVKKNRRWFWQSAKYEPTPFQLNQLLTSADPLDDVKVTSRKLTTYNKTYTFSIGGKIGGQLKALLDVELSGSDTVDVEAKFGDITKDELDQPALLKDLESKYLDVNHEFVKEVCQDPRKVLCVIVGTAKIAEDGEVHMHVTAKGEEKVDLPKVPGSEEEDANISDDSEKKLDIPKDTPISYNICELWVSENGALKLIVDKDSRGGFECNKKDDTDGTVEDLLAKAPTLEEQYRAILQLNKEDREKLVTATLNLCKDPMDVENVFLKLKHGERALPTSSPKTEVLSNIYKMDDAKVVLSMARFDIKEDNSATYPSERSDILEAILCLYEALMELDDDETVALSDCDDKHVKAMIYLFSGTLDGKALSAKDSKLKALFGKDNPSRTFVSNLGFPKEGTLTPGVHSINEIEGAYRAVYALWWDPSEADQEGHTKRWCTLV